MKSFQKLERVSLGYKCHLKACKHEADEVRGQLALTLFSFSQEDKTSTSRSLTLSASAAYQSPETTLTQMTNSFTDRSLIRCYMKCV